MRMPLTGSNTTSTPWEAAPRSRPRSCSGLCCDLRAGAGRQGAGGRALLSSQQPAVETAAAHTSALSSSLFLLSSISSHVDAFVGARLSQDRHLVRAPRHRYHPRPHAARQLDCCQAHAARRAQHQQRLACRRRREEERVCSRCGGWLGWRSGQPEGSSIPPLPAALRTRPQVCALPQRQPRGAVGDCRGGGKADP